MSLLILEIKVRIWSHLDEERGYELYVGNIAHNAILYLWLHLNSKIEQWYYCNKCGWNGNLPKKINIFLII